MKFATVFATLSFLVMNANSQKVLTGKEIYRINRDAVVRSAEVFRAHRWRARTVMERMGSSYLSRNGQVVGYGQSRWGIGWRRWKLAFPQCIDLADPRS
jgi:hypothetical protein